MTRFTTRVELHDADSDDYETLHNEMALAGFTRTIISDSGIEYHLPPGEYNLLSNDTGDHVRLLATNAAIATSKKYSIIVTPSDGRYWINLQQVA